MISGDLCYLGFFPLCPELPSAFVVFLTFLHTRDHDNDSNDHVAGSGDDKGHCLPT